MDIRLFTKESRCRCKKDTTGTILQPLAAGARIATERAPAAKGAVNDTIIRIRKYEVQLMLGSREV
jgi:hypothetical protein